jgi:hypothetical protein
MRGSITRNRVMQEIKLIPEDKLSEVYDFIHYFRIGILKSEKNIDQIMKFAGCWKDMPEKMYKEITEDIGQRRKQAFLRRRNSGTSAG